MLQFFCKLHHFPSRLEDRLIALLLPERNVEIAIGESAPNHSGFPVPIVRRVALHCVSPFTSVPCHKPRCLRPTAIYPSVKFRYLSRKSKNGRSSAGGTKSRAAGRNPNQRQPPAKNCNPLRSRRASRRK